MTNRSSGKTGYAVAQAAQQAGAEVILISGPTALDSPYGVERINVQTAKEMPAAAMSQIHNADVFISVAAVADWHVTNPSAQKIIKSVQAFPMALEFMPNPDLLEEVAALPDGPWCVGVAAEPEHRAEHAQPN